MVSDWFGVVLTVVVTAAVTVLGAYGVRYVVRGLAGADRASLGAFCFMLGAVLVRHDMSRTAEDASRLAGGVVALIIIYRLWFVRQPVEVE